MATEWKDQQTGGHWSHRGIASAIDRGSDFDAATVYLARLGPGSRRTMREALTKLARWASRGHHGPEDMPWHQLRREDTIALRLRLAGNLAPSTANKHLSALRGVLKQCWQQGWMSTEAYREAIDLPAVRGTSTRQPIRLVADDLRALDRACRQDHGPAGARDEALFALLHRAGLRRAEAVQLELGDYDLRSGALHSRREPTSHDSSRRRRIATDEVLRSAVERWILVRGAWPGPLLNPVNKGGRIERRRLSEQAIYIACQKRAAEAGLPRTSPEDLRRAEPEGNGCSNRGSPTTLENRIDRALPQ